jgi:hypothetical protein
VSRLACLFRLGRRFAADQLDQPEDHHQQDGDRNDDDCGGQASEYEDQRGQGHGGDAQRSAVRVGPRPHRAGAQAGMLAAAPDLAQSVREASRVRTAVAVGPARNAPAATTRPTTRTVRSASLMNRTSVSNKAAAASAGSLLLGTLPR